MSRDENSFEIGELDRRSATQDLQARDDIISNILPVRHAGTDGIVMSRDENHPERLEVGIELVDQWNANRDHPARDTITSTSAKYFANGQLILINSRSTTACKKQT